ncbi:penicillin acylase family protein [Litoribacter alkaliphilus]|uniref:Penicillin acylase family protein n=1 Tax=Litoribacter ruber TaxID=702568 RepID=A0AAP2G5R9_9BACT|nr:penicillin acylase family protein [Litoribacter alkaliphilus]MBS9524858.1 penicillin acylase family protein [Litoribacter alkaliphilus]
MKYIAFLISLIITLVLAVALAISIGQTPPLGRLLDPYHGVWQNTYSEDYSKDNEFKIAGLSAQVEIKYDTNLIPHIFAQNEEDLFRAQGFVTAQHRLWQMEFQTMAAAGRVSEIVGSAALDFDRMQRRKGLGFGAEEGLQYIRETDPETFSLMEAYADGVNQYINSLSYRNLPVEYKILNYRPEPWTVYKTALFLKYMADMLVGDKDLEYTNLRKLIGEELMAELYPDFPEDNDPVIEPNRRWDFTPMPINRPDNIIYPDEEILIDPMPAPEEGVGSNNWAVAGSKTQNGHPILANDPHLNLNLPSLWYIIQLSTPEYSVKGASLPGALGVISGFNENIAWGVTNATRDVRDWYSINFRNEDRTEYLYNDQWINSSLRLEEIKIKGESSFIDSVVYTHYGPVVYDPSFRGESQLKNFALKWTAHLGSNEQSTFLNLNRAKNHEDYLAALETFVAPAQNFVFASKTGDIALKVQGSFPLKWDQQGKYLMDGSDPIYEWHDFIPSEQNPATKNPSRGFVSSANQHSVDPSYPYFVFDDSFEHFRNRRLNSRLSEMSKITVEDMMDLQFDNFYLHASEALPLMLDYLLEDTLILEDGNVRRIVQDLQSWSFHTHPELTAPPIFEMWWKNLEEKVWGKWRKPQVPIVIPNKYQTTKLLTNSPDHEVFDKPNSAVVETARELVRESFEAMLQDYEEWKSREDELTWGNYKRTTIQHLVPNFRSFSVENVSTGGGRGILNATSERHGASWRMVVEMGEQPNAFGIYPGGQSGNPGSRYYTNLIGKWARGEYLDVSLRPQSEERDLLYTVTLKQN